MILALALALAWLACAALAAGLLHFAPRPLKLAALLGPLALLYMLGVYLLPDPKPGGEE